MKRVFISLFSLALLVVPCSCGDDDDNDNDVRKEVKNDDSNDEKSDNQEDEGKGNGSKKKDQFVCDIQPLSRTLYFAGEDELDVYVQTNRPMASLQVYVEDEKGEKYEVERDIFHNYIRVHSPMVAGNLFVVVADSNGTKPKKVPFCNLDETNNHAIQAHLETPYIDLLNGEAMTAEEAAAQPGKAWLKLDGEKGIIAAEGFKVEFDDKSSSFDQMGQVRQFKLSNGREGLIVLILIKYEAGKKEAFAFTYCLK